MELERGQGLFVLRMRDGQNRIDADFLDAWNRALDEVETHAGPAALVTTGADRFYSTGLDLERLGGAGRRRVADVMDGLHALLARLLAFPAVTVAAVNGHAFAAGAMLALAHDFRVMRRDRGYLCLPEIDLATGRPLTPGMFALIGARLAPAAFHEALLTGRRYTAQAAAERGMVDEVAGASELLARAAERARPRARAERAPMGALKRSLFAPALEALSRSRWSED